MPFYRSDGVILGILLVCVPMQYFLIKFWGQSSSSRSYEFNQFVLKLEKFHSKYLKWESWKQWCLTLMRQQDVETEPYSDRFPLDFDDPYGESPAIEVIKYKKEEGFFAQSTDPRINRSPEVKFKVGQVVRHKDKKYRGVIIGWDDVAKAPPEWMKSLTGDKEHWRYMPNYAVLVDIRDRLTPQMTYVPQENLEVLTNTKVMHPAIGEYFEVFDGSQYIPRPTIKDIYPYG